MTHTYRLLTTCTVTIAMAVTGSAWSNLDGDAYPQIAPADGSPAQLSVPEGPSSDTVLAPSVITVEGMVWQRELTMWAAHRFEEADLLLPSIDVSFHTSREGCGGFVGLATTGVGRAEVDICLRSARKVLLHEFAHVWAHDLPDTVKQSFVELIGARSWNTVGEWHERGSEHAAEIMAWALLEGNIAPHTSSFAGFESVDSAQTFELLTGLSIPNWDGDLMTPWDANEERS